MIFHRKRFIVLIIVVVSGLFLTYFHAYQIGKIYSEAERLMPLAYELYHLYATKENASSGLFDKKISEKLKGYDYELWPEPNVFVRLYVNSKFLINIRRDSGPTINPR